MSQVLKVVEEDRDATDSVPQIYSLMSKVMAGIGFIAKGRKNQQQGYSFRGIDDVFSALQPELIKHGVFCVPEVQHSEQVERQAKSGGVLIYTVMRVKYTFYAPDGSSVPATVVGEAMDSGDKSSNKAMSAALKYAVLQIFCVPTEAAEDADYHSPEPSPRATKAVATSVSRDAPKAPPVSTESDGKATDAQEKAIANISKSLNLSSDKLKPIFAKAGCVNPSDLTAEQAGHVIAMLNEQVF